MPVVFQFENLTGNIDNYTVFANEVPLVDTDNVVNTITVNGFTNASVIFNLLALDANRLPIFYSFQLYFGSISTLIRVSYANGTSAEGVTIYVNLTSNLLVSQSGLTDANGTITFKNLPSLTVSIFAHSPDNQVARIGLVPSSSVVFLVLVPFDTQNIALIGTEEIITVNTSRVAEVQTISRIFSSPPSATEVHVEYQFITLEIPGNYFGSRYNDYFSVVLRSKMGQYVMKTDSMNGLGLGAFNYSTGATQWYRLSLPVGPVSEVIRLDVNVANVGDSAVDSLVNARLIGPEECSLCEKNCFNCTSEPMCRETCSNPPINSCLFYRECMETKAKCGLTGYPIAYGLQYCSKFLTLSNQFSSSGQTWITNAMACLQQALGLPLINCDSCCALQQIAFDSHPQCYIDNGICNLPATDWMWIVTIVGKDVLNRDIFIQALKAQPQCIPTVLAVIEAQIASESSSIKNALAIVHHWLQSL
ncbi:unnamed protein product [Rotaria sp. Silwood2]|nr:unnamed protein product [Rotaria sp. Silwood2]CAF2924053.1 unnamed protein product [Rotaria sp. Silwood2]CAF3062780.1 unnamed protein product [Rotaria sp. Silwood2]CAF3349817.1 unnamed protein product [Rotaria sp. Silwood2]CAF4186422.1 unnamed protein product [Rotaria sp. Silwood2]